MSEAATAAQVKVLNDKKLDNNAFRKWYKTSHLAEYQVQLIQILTTDH